MKIGDMVILYGAANQFSGIIGVIIGFNEKGEGGKEFVHVLIEGNVQVFMEFDLEVINETR